MKKQRIYFYFICLICFFYIGCSSDDQEILNTGRMSATINGEFVELKTERAKVFAGDNGRITIQGSNCSAGYVVIFLEVPLVTGNYTLGPEIAIDLSRSRAIACNETGSSTPQNVIEGTVRVTEVTNARIKGTFNLVAESFDPQIVVQDIVENGMFDVVRAD